MVTHTGEREIRAVFGRLPDNSGELACMVLCYFFECIPLGMKKKKKKKEEYFIYPRLSHQAYL